MKIYLWRDGYFTSDSWTAVVVSLDDDLELNVRFDGTSEVVGRDSWRSLSPFPNAHWERVL